MSTAKKQREYRIERSKVDLTELARKIKDPDALLISAEAALVIRSSESQLGNWRAQSEGPKYVKLGWKVFYRVKDLKKHIEENVIDPSA